MNSTTRDNVPELSANDSHNEDPSCRESDASPKETDLGNVISKRETRFVWLMRILVLLVLALSTTTVAVATYRFTSRNEHEAFTASFRNNGNKVVVSVTKAFYLSMTGIDSFVAGVVAAAKVANQTWPFVTLPDYELRAAKTRALCKSVAMSQVHVVTSNQRVEWETYTANNNWWVNESITMQGTDPYYYGPIIYDFDTVDFIFNFDDEPQPERPLYLVGWQESPTIPIFAPYNWDLLAEEPNTTVVALLESHTAHLSNSQHLPDPDIPDWGFSIEWYANYVRPGQDASEPVFSVFYPILNKVDEIAISDPASADLVGILIVSIFWRSLFEEILAEEAVGVVVVVDNPFTPSFTFVIDGPVVRYLGHDDRHDPSFDRYVMTSNLLDFESFDIQYSGVKVNTDDECHSLIPAISITKISGQRLVVRTASKTDKIVSSLFPEAVRDRLLLQADEQHQQHPPSISAWGIRKGENPNDYLSQNDNDNRGDEFGNAMIMSTQPIADLFPNTTIFFADLVGFTKWSAVRSPSEVFRLLETIFGAFDRIARRRGVFKVETVGDCYVAVTGLPKAQEKHAVIMVLFATECMAGLGTILNQLAVSGLGDDTKQLAMRVGLHSGPTTAGVLRGDKGRFQLFGDTVNTASRMESNGIASRIHVSQSTANELIAKGKGHWLTARDETIVAKGKGEMQTYFVTVGTSDLGGSSYDYGRKASLVSEDSGLNSALDGSGDDSDHLKWIGQKLSERYGKNMVGMDKK